MALALVEWVSTVRVASAASLQDCVERVQRLEFLTPGMKAEMAQFSLLSLSTEI